MRLDEWKERLFDLGKSNRLVNFKDTQRSTIDIIFPVSDKFFRTLTSGRKQEFFDIDAYLAAKDKKKNPSEILPDVEELGKNLKSGEILAFRPEVPLRSLIRELVRKAKESLTERGVNVLYAAFGFLHWRETGNSRQELTSPLVLVPVKISRESLVSPFVLQEYEDEILTNPTLLYKLRIESNLQLPPMSEDQGLSEYLDSVSALVEKLGWTISREVKIAPVSFLKMDMYLDLRDNEALVLANPNARMIMDSSAWGTMPSPAGTSAEAPGFLHNVVNADASQTAAILKAKKGENFVLQGPPGTGKSQTITNIIAECMADGKRILFVSEKMAALQVVFSNLKKVGLDDFCLELHSHKTQKKAVIDELARVLNQPKTTTNGKAFDEIAELLKAKRQLDGYASALHAPVPGIGKSLYQIFGEISRAGNRSITGFLLRDIRKKKTDYLAAAVEVLDRYCGITPDLGYDYRKNPWNGFRPLDVSFEHQKETGVKLEKILPALETVQSSLDGIGEILGNPLASLDDFFRHQDFLGFLAGLSWHHPKIFVPESLPSLLKSFENMAEISAGILRNRAELEAVFLPDFFKRDGENLWNELALHYRSFVRRLGRGYRSYRATLLELRKDPRKRLGHKELTRLASLWKDEQAARKWFSELEPVGREILGERFNGIETGWETPVRDLRKISGYMGQKMSMAGLPLFSTDEFSRIQDRIKTLLDQFTRAWETVRPGVDFLRADFDRDLFDPYRDEIGIVVSKFRLCFVNRHLMEPWLRVLRLLDEAGKMEIREYLDAVLDAKWPLDDFVPGFTRLFYEQWAHAVIEDDPVLRDFNRTYQDRAVQIFSEKDQLQFDIAKARVRESLSVRRPSLDCLSPGSPISILLRESQKKRNLMPVRILIREIPDLVQLLKPCFLMSPLSVSTYLDPQAIQFDTVIFDEASQIFPQDALGAIYRSKQVIVVGDTRQMPPSNFFTASVVLEEGFSEETYEETAADYESILDICATRFPQNRLKWHYRSQTEDLIAFSNAHYYDGSLITFPSAHAARKDFGVEFFHLPEGRFDRSTKTNQLEAEFIADLVFTHFHDHPERSLGVVAFSLSQQEIIESLIEARREKDSSMEVFFAEDRKEPFFVKNLETVQGDERDTILFSIAYGKDAAGKFYHNFGPLNQAGGERRLNVAVTRAKMNVKVVSSIRALDIDLGKTQSVGVRFLKEYLEYAESGSSALVRFCTSPKGEMETGFDNQVMQALNQAGYEVDDEFGCSEFRIDLAVRKPGSKDHFLAVECDGIAYSDTKNARDRDRLRREVLEKMGWKYYRIWSTDWFKNTQVEIERLLAFAAAALKDSTGSEDKLSLFPGFSVISGENGFVEKKAPIFRFPPHEWADINALFDRFYYAIGFIGFLIKVVEVEGPVSIDALLPRITFLFESTKVTQRVRDDFQERIKIALQRGQLKMADGFLAMKLQDIYRLRIPKEGEEKREVPDISIPELAGGLVEITRQNMEVSKDGLIKTASALLGVQRVGPIVQERMEKALAYSVEKGLLLWQGNPLDPGARLSVPKDGRNR